MMQLNQHVMVDSNALSIILLSAGLMSLVVTVMGIKLRWFRHRLTFEQPADDPVLLKTTSVTEIRENCARGVYRQSVDPESQTYQDIPSKVVINGKTKTKSNSDRQSIFRLPFKSKLNFSKVSTRDEAISTPFHQTAPSVSSPSRDKDVTTFQKNENLKRLIHQRLQSQNSRSMSDLKSVASSTPKQYRERSIDEIDGIQELSENVDFKKVVQNGRRLSSEELVRAETAQKKVKFEVVEDQEMQIEETKVFAQIENDFGESLDFDENSYKRELSTESEVIPPTPMKRKSREEYFQLSTEQESESIIELRQESENEAPVVKPRTKSLVQPASDMSSPGVLPRIEIGTLQEIINVSDEKHGDLHQENIETEVEVAQVLPKSILKSSETSNSSKTITFMNLPHTISDTETSSSSSEMSSESGESDEDSEEDVWSRVDQHRNMLNRPPPLPRTPPPSTEEESKQFSFA